MKIFTMINGMINGILNKNPIEEDNKSKVLSAYNQMKEGKIIRSGAFIWKIEEGKVYRKTDNMRDWEVANFIPIHTGFEVATEKCKNCKKEKVDTHFHDIYFLGEEHRVCDDCIDYLRITTEDIRK